MQRRWLNVAVLSVSICFIALRGAAQEQAPSRAMLGKKIPNLLLKNAAGKGISLYDFKNKKAIVLVFLSFDCPVSNSYAKPLADIHKEFREYGVSILGLTTNEDQTAKEVERQAKEYQIPFPVMIDHDFKAADAVKANTTPEVFVLDGNFVLRYRGRIDNAFYARLKRNHEVSCHDLHQVLGELMSGRPVSVTATEAIGCPIQRELKNVAKDGPVTYYRDVLPILQKNCQHCHRPGEVGQFSLLNYRQAVNWAQDIKEFTARREMPPWKPTAGLPFHNERRLSQKDIDALARWVDCGKPKGNPKQAPPPRQFTSGWQLGEPDLVLTVPKSFQLGPDGYDVFRCFPLPTNLNENKYVRAVEIRPGNPRIVHHALLFVDTTRQGRKLERLEKEGKNTLDPHHTGPESLDKGPGYSVSMGVGFTPSGGLGGWAPGIMPRPLPKGYGYYLPKNSDVVLQVHYHRNGRLENDQTKIGIYFGEEKQTQPYQSGILAGADGKAAFPLFFSIPAGAENYKLTGSLWATADCQLFSITPHMHLLGKAIKVTMTPRGGNKQTVVEIKNWEYNWQEIYYFKTPLQVRSGTRFDVEAIYDNSAKNRHNPNNPPKTVTFGEQTTNEMCFVFFGGASARPGRRLPMSRTAPAINRNDD